MITYDTIIVGGGIVGAATAYSLAKHGQHVVLIDQFEPGHTHGSSHGDGRVVRFNYPEPIYVEMAKVAYPAWQALGEVAGRPLLKKTGLAEMGPHGSEKIAAQRANFEQTGVPYDYFTGEAYMQRYPQVKLPADSEVLLQADGAAAFATPAVLALWQLVTRLGGETVSRQHVTAIEASDARVIVRAAEQQWQAQKVVIAAGSWVNQLLAPLGVEIPLHVTQEQLAYFAPKDDTDHRLGNINILLDWHKSPPFYTIPQIDVPGLKVGWHHTGQTADPDNRPAEKQAIYDGMSAYVAERFPHLDSTPFETVTCLYTNTLDYHFVMDTHPTLNNVVIGAGFSGHGFKFGPVLGDMLGALVLQTEPPVSLDNFTLARFEHPESLTPLMGA
jgi:monomeric sarcosine oxidase